MKHERVIQLSAPIKTNGSFITKTHNGSITINGADVTDCNVTATIIARAGSKEDAKRLAEEVRVKLQGSNDKLVAIIQKPKVIPECIVVNLVITVPNQAILQLDTYNGIVKIANITSQVNCTTHNGEITTTQVCGTVNLRTYNGNVKVIYPESVSPSFGISIVTRNGDITFTSPPDFSATVEALVHNGEIHVDLPINVREKVNKKKLNGKIGTGEGKLSVEAYNGSIIIK
jgi:DUF4097 and DUF4098 domain-containing protein YvlB